MITLSIVLLTSVIIVGIALFVKYFIILKDCRDIREEHDFLIEPARVQLLRDIWKTKKVYKDGRFNGS